MIIKKSLSELQSELPIGIKLPDGKFYRNFKFREWMFDEEEKVAELKNKNLSMGDFVTELLRIMLIEIGNVQVSQIPNDEFKMMILNSFLADVFYMYIFLRYESLGDELPIELQCGRCTRAYKFIGELSSLEITMHVPDEPLEEGAVWNPLEFARQTVELRRGISYKGKTFKTATLQPGTWNVMRAISEGDFNEALMKKKMLQSSIVDLPGVEMPVFSFTEEMVRSLNKRDLETLIKKSSEVNGGPELTIETRCRHCNTFNKYPIDWRYDAFFALS